MVILSKTNSLHCCNQNQSVFYVGKVQITQIWLSWTWLYYCFVNLLYALQLKVILDVDTGIDDSHAILLALAHHNVEILAITCANGNVNVDLVVENTLRVLKACGREDVSRDNQITHLVELAACSRMLHSTLEVHQ